MSNESSQNKIYLFFMSIFAFFGLLIGLFISDKAQDEPIELDLEAEDFE